jgi:hypothetical protein
MRRPLSGRLLEKEAGGTIYSMAAAVGLVIHSNSVTLILMTVTQL